MDLHNNESVPANLIPKTSDDISKKVCEICNRSFNSTRQLTNHQTIHSDETPYQCQVCGKKFKRFSYLYNHKKIHEKPYPCRFCYDRFITANELSKHTQTHKKNGKLYQCGVCGKKIKTRRYLMKHMEKVCSKLIYIKVDTRKIKPHLFKTEKKPLPSQDCKLETDVTDLNSNQENENEQTDFFANLKLESEIKIEPENEELFSIKMENNYMEGMLDDTTGINCMVKVEPEEEIC